MVETYLCAFCSYQQDDWVDYLPLAEFVFMNCGFHPVFNLHLSDHVTMNPASQDFAAGIDLIHSELKAELACTQVYMARYVL